MTTNPNRLRIRECLTYDLAQPQSFRWHLKAFLLWPGHQAVVLYRLSQQMPGALPSLIQKMNLLLNGADISPAAKIGKGLRLEHSVGVVIGQHVTAGQNLRLLQHVTLGQKNGLYPVIGDNVTVHVCASVLGDIHIGDGAVVGAHALVLSDVPANTTVVGVPARPIRKADKNQVNTPNTGDQQEPSS